MRTLVQGLYLRLVALRAAFPPMASLYCLTGCRASGPLVLSHMVVTLNKYTAFEVINNSNNNNSFTKENKEPIIIKREILNSILRRNRNRVTY